MFSSRYSAAFDSNERWTNPPVPAYELQFFDNGLVFQAPEEDGAGLVILAKISVRLGQDAIVYASGNDPQLGVGTPLGLSVIADELKETKK